MSAIVDLVPAPRRLERHAGSLDLSRGLRLAAPSPFPAEAEACLGLLGRARDSAAPSLSIVRDPALGPEEHRIVVGAEGIALEAGSAAGAYRALSSLRQLGLSNGASLPCLRIEDGPRFPWRGFMLDTVRSFFPVEFLERVLDLMALHKLSVFHWHLTDDQGWRLEIPGRPELTRWGASRLDRRFNPPSRIEGAYSPADVRRVVAYAAERHIVVVPEIETPGHATALLASHPELSCRGAAPDGGAFAPESRFGVFEEILCAGNEEVFGLLAEVYDAVAELFPGPWVHAGGDEAPKARWESCPRCKALMRGLGLRDEAGGLDAERLQSWFMGRVADLLAARGKRLVGWDEILDGDPRKDAVVMSWRGFLGGAKGARAGHEVVMSPQTKACYLDHRQLDRAEEPGRLGLCTLSDSYAFEAMPEGLSAEEEARILGGQANLWTEIVEFGRTAEYMMFPRLCAVAESLWSPREARDLGDFLRRMEAHGARLDALGVNRFRGPAR